MAIIAPTPLFAADNHYIGSGTGNWQDASNWSNGAPSTADTTTSVDAATSVMVVVSGVTRTAAISTLTINALNILGPTNALSLDSTASTSVPLTVRGAVLIDGGASLGVAGGAFRAGDIDVGGTGTGVFAQSDGDVGVGGDLHLGRYNGGAGYYTLGGGSLAVDGSEYLGQTNSTDNTFAVFQQAGGTHTIAGQLSLGDQTAGSARYFLAGGSLNASGGATIGPVGALSQTGGTFHVVGSANHSSDLSITGYYSLSQPIPGNPTAITVDDSESIGSPAAGGSTATVMQYGGMHQASGNLLMAPGVGSVASYTLIGGAVSARNCYVGGDATSAGGTATFTIVGGVATIGSIQNGALVGQTHIWPGGTLNLVDGGVLATGSMVNDGLISQSGGHYELSGTITGTGAIRQSAGTAKIAAGTTVDSGTVEQSGGSADAAGDFLLATNGASVASLSLSGTGTATVHGLLGVGANRTALGGGVADVVVAGHALLYADTIQLGDARSGIGRLTVTDQASVTVGGGLMSIGAVTVTGGSLAILNQAPPVSEDPVLNRAIVAGYQRSGSVTVSGGSVSSPYIKLGVTAGDTGTYNQTGGLAAFSVAMAVGGNGAGGGSGVGSVNISGGTTTVGDLIVGSPVGGVGAAQLSGTGVLNVFGSVTVFNGSSLSVHSAGAVNLLPAATGSTADVIAGLSVDAGGKLDIADRSLILPGAGLPTIIGLIRTGLVSSSIADPSHTMLVGAIANNDGSGHTIYDYLTTPPDPKKLGLYDGTAPGLNDVLVRLTYAGDANLNGVLDGSDYTRIDNGFLTRATGWYGGDFNYDGTVDGSDFTLIDNAFNRQGAKLFPTALAASPAAVPEPSVIALFSALPILAGRFQRRRGGR